MTAAPLRIASYNIRKAIGTDRRRAPERILAVLDEIAPDVVMLQECDRRFGTRASVFSRTMLEDHGWQAVPVAQRPHSMGWHGNGILVRADTQIIDSEPLHLPALEPRGAVMADLRVHGRLIRVVGMHLDLSGLWRRRQAAAVMAHVAACRAPLPTILAGDLNEWRTAGGCLQDFGRHYRFADTGPSFHATRPIGRLDRILFSADLQVVESRVHVSALARHASDHLPIWATLTPA